MPVMVKKCGDKWCIVEKATGKVVGHSDTKLKAHISAGYRNRAWKKKKK